MVEFAFVVPLLLLLILGIFDFGRAINYWIDETHIANEAARFAAVDYKPATLNGPGGVVSCSSTLQDCIRQTANSGELRDGTGQITQRISVCISYTSPGNVGDPIDVTASAKYQWLPFLKQSPGTVTVAGHATMRREARPVNVTAGCAT